MASSALAATVAYEASTLTGPAVGGIEPVSGTEIRSTNAAYDDAGDTATNPASEFVWVDDLETVDSAVFEFTFDMSQFIVGTASLSGLWAVDNLGTVSLNGTELASFSTTTTATFDDILANGAYGTSDAALFNSGMNTLRFELQDDGGPAGFRATAVVTATPVPVPGALSLALGGMAAFGALRVMRRRS
jgi:hypothetical protein